MTGTAATQVSEFDAIYKLSCLRLTCQTNLNYPIFPLSAGMTGTAATEVSEFDGIYKLPVAVVPTNRAISRTDNPDVVFRLEKYKWAAVVQVRGAWCGKYKRGVASTSILKHSTKC